MNFLACMRQTQIKNEQKKVFRNVSFGVKCTPLPSEKRLVVTILG